jgi:hypothetical protein
MMAVTINGSAPSQSQRDDLRSTILYPRSVVLPSGVAWMNTSTSSRTVNVSGGTVSAVYLATAAAPTTYVTQGSTSGNFTVASGGQIKLDWSVQPTITIS